MKKFYTVLLIFPLIVITLTGQAGSCRNEVSSTAFKEYKYFLDLIPDGYEKQYGFSARQDFDRISLGSPLIMIFTNKSLLKSNIQDFNKNECRYYEYRVPLIVRDTIRALITISEVNGKFKAVDLGAASVSRSIDSISKKVTSFNSSQSFVFRFTDLNCDFLAFNLNGDLGQMEIFPLPSAYFVFKEYGIYLPDKLSMGQLIIYIDQIGTEENNK